MRPIALLLVLCLTCACSTSPSRREPSYRPVPDQRLFARIDDVDGIERADVTYSDSVANPGYAGVVWMDSDLSQSEATTALNTVYAILRQGRPREPIFIQAIQDKRYLQSLPGVPRSGTRSELEKIYGPQPGDGKPPSS